MAGFHFVHLSKGPVKQKPRLLDSAFLLILCRSPCSEIFLLRPVSVPKRSLRLLGIISDFTSLREREIEGQTIILATLGKERNYTGNGTVVDGDV